jgi:hypothetical protein
MGLHGFLRGYIYIFTFIYVHGVRTSQKTHIQTPTACYGYSFAFLFYNKIKMSDAITFDF